MNTSRRLRYSPHTPQYSYDERANMYWLAGALGNDEPVLPDNWLFIAMHVAAIYDQCVYPPFVSASPLQPKYVLLEVIDNVCARVFHGKP